MSLEKNIFIHSFVGLTGNYITQMLLAVNSNKGKAVSQSNTLSMKVNEFDAGTQIIFKKTKYEVQFQREGKEIHQQ